MRSGWSVLFFVAAELLIWSGAVKIARPDPAITALQAAHLPARRTLARALGAAELAVGALCLIDPTPVSALMLAVLYLGFAGFLLASVLGLIRTPSCGCFGTSGSSPSSLHLALNLIGAAAGMSIAVGSGLPGLWRFALETPFQGVPLIMGMAAAGFLTVLAATMLPALFFSYRPREGQGR